MSVLVPARRRGVEYLDDPGTAPAVRTRSLRDVARSNSLFGGLGAVLTELRPIFRTGRGERLVMLDVGSGIGDIPRAARRLARSEDVHLDTIALDNSEELAGPSREGGNLPCCADALALPFADRSADIVMCSQLLHHFPDEETDAVIAEMHRVARRHVIIADIRRSWIAAAGIWLASFPLRFHPVSRHDGVVSVLRGFTPRELGALVRRATGVTPSVRRHRGYRITATWSVAG